MDGVGTPIIGRPRPLPGHDTPNPAYHPHTLNYEEPHYFANVEILVDRKPIEIKTPEDILKIPENWNISIRGLLMVARTNVEIVFYTQVHFINVYVECNNEELKNLDYEHYNKFIGKFIDNMEIAMNMPEEQLKAGR